MIAESVWADAFPRPLARFSDRPSGDEIIADVVIVGGGFTGLSAALHLASQNPDRRIVVLEAGRIGAGASGRNTGMIGPGVGQSLPALARRLGPDRAGALYRETLRAVETVRELIARERIDCGLTMTGQIVLARSRADRRRLRRQLALMTKLDLPVEHLDDAAQEATIRLAPAAGTAADGPAALRLPVAGVLHPGQLLSGLVAACARRGIRIYEAALVASIDGGSFGDKVQVRVVGGGRVIADRAVVATAGYTPRLGLMRGRVLPVVLQALATVPLPAAALARLGWNRREGVVEARRIFNYFRLTADDRLVFGGGAPRYPWGAGAGADEERGMNDRSVVQSLAALRAEVVRTFGDRIDPALLVPSHGWTGTIGYVLDALPAIGWIPKRPRIMHVGGWCGHGVALSLASGAWVTRLFDDHAEGDGVIDTAPGGDVSVAADSAWFRGEPPRVPFEIVRWTAFRGSVAAMSLLDRFC